MTFEQALQILDRAAAQAQLTREDHYKVQLAIEAIKTEWDRVQGELEKAHPPGAKE